MYDGVSLTSTSNRVCYADANQHNIGGDNIT